MSLTKIAQLLNQIAFSFQGRLIKIRGQQRSLLINALNKDKEIKLQKIREELNN